MTTKDIVLKDSEEALHILEIMDSRYQELREFHELIVEALQDEDIQSAKSHLGSVATCLMEIRTSLREAFSVCGSYIEISPDDEDRDTEEEDAVEEFLDEFNIDELVDPEDDSEDDE